MSLLKFVRQVLIAAALAACAQHPQAPLRDPAFFAKDNPANLRDWGMVQTSQRRLVIGAAVVPYDLNTPLFTDYAQKLRTIWMPPGASGDYDSENVFDLPVGTVITKTFFYQVAPGDETRVMQVADQGLIHSPDGGLDLSHVRLVETRLLVHRDTGWTALTYVWNEDQTEASLQRTGAVVPLELVRTDGRVEAFRYVVPNVTQCAGCHASDVTTRVIHPIGPKARHLNRDYAYPDGAHNQLARLAAAGYLRGVPEDVNAAPRAAVWTDTSLSLDSRARAYLDINCSHCHNKRGPADTSGLYLDHDRPLSGNYGRCKLPVAAGRGTGDLRFDIVPGNAAASIMPHRMRSTEPAVMMPEMGRSTAHLEGVALIESWISEMEGSCR